MKFIRMKLKEKKEERLRSKKVDKEGKMDKIEEEIRRKKRRRKSAEREKGREKEKEKERRERSCDLKIWKQQSDKEEWESAGETCEWLLFLFLLLLLLEILEEMLNLSCSIDFLVF